MKTLYECDYCQHTFNDEQHCEAHENMCAAKLDITDRANATVEIILKDPKRTMNELFADILRFPEHEREVELDWLIGAYVTRLLDGYYHEQECYNETLALLLEKISDAKEA